MNDFPRNWQYFATEAGTVTAASITVPAIANVSHVLTSLVAQLASSGAADVAARVTVAFGGTTVWQGFLLAVAPVAPATHSNDELSWSGMLQAAPGTAIVVAFNVASATLTEALTIQGYEL